VRAQVVDVDAARGHRLGRDLGEPGREEVVVQLTPEQVLGREVATPFAWATAGAAGPRATGP
jgi:hypothetical protein